MKRHRHKPSDILFNDNHTVKQAIDPAGGEISDANPARLKLAESAVEAAKISQEQEKRILQSVMDCAGNSHLVYLDRNFNFVRVNEKYARTCGYAPEDMIGKNHFDLFPHDENEAIFARVRDTGIPVEFHDKPFVFPDKPERGVTYWDWTLTPVKYPSGEVEGLIFSLVETTERKRAELALHKSELRYRDLVESTHDWTWETDSEGVYTYSSQQVFALLGYQPEEVLGRKPFDFMPDDEALRVREEFDRLCEQPAPFRNLINVNRHKDGRAVTLETNGMPFFDEKGILAGFRGMDRDITERIRIEKNQQFLAESLMKANVELEIRVVKRTEELEASRQELARQNERLMESYRTVTMETSERIKAVEALRAKEQMLIQQSRQAAMGEMIGNIAHQWRQPLNTLGLTIQQLGLFYDYGNFDREFLVASVGKSMELIRYMSKTIDDFRNYFSPDKEKINFKAQEAIDSTLSLIEAGFRNQQISIDVVALADPVIYGYQNEYAQALLNILNNARDAITDQQVGEPNIFITLGMEEGRAVVTITDNGGGIPEDIMEKIFDPYFTTKGPDKGTGIGLFMSKAIIERNMGGRLAVRNTGSGAEFRIEV